MNAVLLLTCFLCCGHLNAPAESLPPSQELATFQDPPTPGLDTTIRTYAHNIFQAARNWSAGAAFGVVSILTKIGWELSRLTPWESPLANECLLLSHICETAARNLFAQPLPSNPLPTPPSHHSWHLNQFHLSQIPTSTLEEKQLLDFLEKRWLAKSTGCYPTLIDWVCPTFDIHVQTHPETTNSYARDPWNKCSLTYNKRVDGWKQSLPHPHHFPLILTRPYAIDDYLPYLIEAPSLENLSIDALQTKENNPFVVINLSHLFSNADTEWLNKWNEIQTHLAQACKTHQINPSQLLCIQTVSQEGIGGIRILPLATLSHQEIEEQHQFLLHRISKSGLAANRVELDRWSLSSILPTSTSHVHSIPSPISLEEFLDDLDEFEHLSSQTTSEKQVMLTATIQVLRGLLASISKEKWDHVLSNPTRSAITQLSFKKINQELHLLRQEEALTFFDLASHLEQIHANITALLEIFSPYTAGDFPQIYLKALASIPQDLRPLTKCGIHASGMTNLAGIIKAVGTAFSKSPYILYGDNTYFENIYESHIVSRALPLAQATQEDYCQADLILAQFNPILRRIDYKVTHYRVENVSDTLRDILNARAGKPLTLAVDCTLDYLDSPRVAHLLSEFQTAIEQGTLNVICYRSGIKFDLFGMDNYCGAPLFMIHNQDAHWIAFDRLITDPLLQTDRLSINWFCLAFSYAKDQLECYRKHIFDNTRALLEAVPKRLLTDQTAKYQIVPIESSADAAFIDIKVYGPFHQMRTSLLGGFLILKSMEQKHPLFCRPSLGFYHPNLSILFSDTCSTIRLTLGLDPSQVKVLADAFEIIDSMNTSINHSSIITNPSCPN